VNTYFKEGIALRIVPLDNEIKIERLIGLASYLEDLGYKVDNKPRIAQEECVSFDSGRQFLTYSYSVSHGRILKIGNFNYASSRSSSLNGQ
jgi:hypothetical protein